MFPGNRAPAKHPDLIAVSLLTTGPQMTSKFSCRVWEGNWLGKLWVTLNPAVAGLRKEEL